MNRRDLFTCMAARVASWMATDGLTPLPAAQRTRRKAASRPVDKQGHIAISSWSFHNYFQSTREREFNLPGSMLVLLDFPEMIVDRYKVHNFEFVAPHFASTEPTYLAELKNHLVATHSRLVNIPVDIEEIDAAGGLSDHDEKVRDRAIEAAIKWIDIAHTLGASAVRCNPGAMDPADLTTTVSSYKRLAAYGKSRSVQVIIENHGGVGSENPEELVRLFKLVGTGSIGALPDFGNFPDEATREKGLRLLFAYARVVSHAKGLQFDAAGNETRYDFPKCIAVAKTAGYKGVYSVEYEGPGDPYDGVQKVVNELDKYL
jgi:sugar phosphate isomerase/epimerase